MEIELVNLERKLSAEEKKRQEVKTVMNREVSFYGKATSEEGSNDLCGG